MLVQFLEIETFLLIYKPKPGFPSIFIYSNTHMSVILHDLKDIVMKSLQTSYK